MAITRKLLDWKQPALPAAADFLLARYRQADSLDLSGAIVVLPVTRAGRRLLEILVVRCEEEGLALTPPKILTTGTLPEQLYQPKRPFASTLTQQLAWVAALRKIPPQRLQPFLPHPPAADDALRWLELGDMLRRLHEELAEDALNFRHVLQKAATIDGFTEHDRWAALAEIQAAYHLTLDSLELWDKQTARLVAIEKREINTDRDVILVGMVDLNTAQRQMLDQVADRVTTLVFAPPDECGFLAPRETNVRSRSERTTLGERFDQYGCLVPSAWTTAELPIRDEQVQRVDGPADQAEAVTQWLATLGGRYRADQITVGLPDASLAPQIERELAQCGVESRWVEAKRLPETGPYRLLQLATDYAVRRRFRDLAALIRHPDVYDWLLDRLKAVGGMQDDILTTLDKFACERFPARIDEERLEKDADLAPIRTLYAAIDYFLHPLAGPPQTLAAWVRPLKQLLLEVYGQRVLDRNQPQGRYLYEALKETAKALDALADVPEPIQLQVDARQAVRFALDALANSTIPPPAQADAVELLGWLELPLDDAPALIVTTFNDGVVPASTHADLFLPNCLREQLGVLDNDRRLARDAYALSVLLASREAVKLVVGHRDADGNPLVPSRLLFAADTDTVIRRATQFFAEPPPAPPRRSLLAPAKGAPKVSELAPPRPVPLKEPITDLSVTSFKNYIACPYRFYLRHVLDLVALSDEAAELDGAAFGVLVHDVLEQFGRADEAKDAREAVDPKRIVDYLNYQLDRVAAARFGKYSRPAINVQIEQIRLRLAAFAAWQAQRTREGWRIVHSEDSERQLRAGFAVDGEPFTLRGRIDRIDYHDGLARLCVLDYKTSDEGSPPEKIHRKKGEWIDLQLPLYRHLLRGAKLPSGITTEAPIDLGYIVLPKSTQSLGLALAEWTSEELESADERAREVIRSIRQQIFWPPALPPPDFADDVAAICQDNRLGSWRQATEGDAA